MAMTTEMTARGIMVLVAIMVISAPRGQSSEMSCQPMADRVPTPTWVANPTATTAMTARGNDSAESLGIHSAGLL